MRGSCAESAARLCIFSVCFYYFILFYLNPVSHWEFFFRVCRLPLDGDVRAGMRRPAPKPGPQTGPLHSLSLPSRLGPAGDQVLGPVAPQWEGPDL